MSITIVGLGPGNPDHLTLETWQALSRAKTAILRTARHPTVRTLPEGPSYRSLDDWYHRGLDNGPGSLSVILRCRLIYLWDAIICYVTCAELSDSCPRELVGW